MNDEIDLAGVGVGPFNLSVAALADELPELRTRFFERRERFAWHPGLMFRGSRMQLEAIHPDGRRELLTDATHYEQTWQVTYKYKTPHLFPAGTILHTVSWHDNTANNRHNPDPTAWIGWGSRTMDEMGHGWTDIAFLTEAQYQEELAQRRTQPATATEPRQR